MGLISTIEANASNFYKGFPHLPRSAQSWLGANIWWLTLVGLIMLGLAIFPFLAFVGPVSLLLIGLGGPVGAAIGGFALIVGTLIFSVAIIEFTLFAMAIKPLKEGKKSGWNLLLTALIIAPLAALFSILTFDFGAIISWSLILLLGGYLLFEIRGHFVAKKAKK